MSLLESTASVFQSVVVSQFMAAIFNLHHSDQSVSVSELCDPSRMLFDGHSLTGYPSTTGSDCACFLGHLTTWINSLVGKVAGT